MTDIDLYVNELSSRLHVGRRERARILTEVRDHLDDSLEHQQQAGEQRASAIAHALDAFGSPPLLAAKFNAAAGTRAMRRAPIIAFLAGLTVLAGFLVAGTTQTHSTTPTNATVPTQVSFFFAVLSFQIAIVAGICAGSRALALWQGTAVPGDDRRFVRRCSIISACALGVAALGWAMTMRFAFDRLVDPNPFTLVCGGTIMLVGAALGIAATYRLGVNPADELGDDNATRGGFAGIGEACIGFVRRHPVVSCTAIAVVSIFPAMSHAETTLAGALPWGLIQAGTVVLGFVVLGPALGLRPAHETTESATS